MSTNLFKPLVDVKDHLYSIYEGNEWFRGAGLYKKDKKDNKSWVIRVFVKVGFEDRIPNKWGDIEVEKSVFGA